MSYTSSLWNMDVVYYQPMRYIVVGQKQSGYVFVCSTPTLGPMMILSLYASLLMQCCYYRLVTSLESRNYIKKLEI